MKKFVKAMAKVRGDNMNKKTILAAHPLMLSAGFSIGAGIAYFASGMTVPALGFWIATIIECGLIWW